MSHNGAIATGTGFLTGWRAEQYRRNHPTSGAIVPEPVVAPAPPIPTPEPVVTSAPDFAAMTREELRAEAKRLGIVGMGRMLKPDLIAAVAAAYVSAA